MVLLARRARARLAVLVLAASWFAAACATYAPRPIDAEQNAGAFRARRLDAPELVSFAKDVLPADTPFPPERWNAAALTLVALHENPELAAACARFEAARARLESAGERPNPTLGLDTEYTANTGVLPWALGFTLDFPIETGSKRDARITLARREEELARIDYAASAWSLRSAVRAAMTAYFGARGERERATDEALLHARRLELVRARIRAGDEDRGAELRAVVARDRVLSDIESADGRAEEARIELARALGVPRVALDDVTLDWPGFESPSRDLAGPQLPSARVASDGLAASPLADHALVNRADVRRALAEYAVAEAQLELEVARQYPDVSIGPGFQWDRGDHKWRFAFSIPLPVLDAHRGPIAEASAARDTREAEFAAIQARVLGDVELAERRYRHADSERAAAFRVEEGLATLAKAARRALEAGECDALAVLDADLELAHAKRETWLATVRVEEAIGLLSDALATPLDGRPLPDFAPAFSEERRP